MKIKKHWKTLKLKNKVLLLFLPINIFTILIIMTLSVSLIVHNGKKDMTQNSIDKLTLVCNQTDQIISNIKYNIKAFSTSSALQTAIYTDYPNNNYGNYMFSSAMHASIYNIMDIGSIISSGYIHTFDGRVYHIKSGDITKPTKEMDELYDEITAYHGQMVFIPPTNLEDPSAFNISKSLIDIDTGTCLGILSFNIKEKLFYDSYHDIIDESNESLLISNQWGQIISSKDRTQLQTPVNPSIWNLVTDQNIKTSQISVSNKKNLLLTQATQEEPFYVIYTIRYYNIYKDVLILALLLILIGLLILTFTSLLSQFLARSLVKPIIQLANYADAIGNGNLGIPVSVTSEDEIGFLASRFQHMNHNIYDLTNRIYNEQNQKREYELNLLQAQVNPHFLYNCLDSISSLVYDNQGEVAINMIHHLGCYYRGVLSKGRNLISIQEEMEIIKDYLEIQLIKAPDLFTYSIDIEEGLEELKILKMLIQPLVENSIIHGFTGYTNKGHINIKVTSLKNIVSIIVTDNGRGMSKNTLSQLFKPNKMAIPKHFGLQNVQNRIQLKYGDAYGLAVSSIPDRETTIKVNFTKTY